MTVYIKASQFPTKQVLVEGLRALDREPPLSPDEMLDDDYSWRQLGVRLQVLPSEIHEEDAQGRRIYAGVSWRLWTGDASYDTDHRGYWGYICVPFLGDPDGDDLEAEDRACDLREKALEDAAVDACFIDDLADVAAEVS